MLLDALGTRLLENLLTGKETVITNKSTIRGGQDF